MDEFGVFTEKYGLKPQGKSAPMAESRRSANARAQNFDINSSLNIKSSSTAPSNSNSTYGSYLDGLNGPFQSSGKSHSFGGLNGDSDLFGTSNTTVKQSNDSRNFDFDSFFMGSSNSSSGYVDDIFGEMSGVNIPVSSKKEGLYSSTSSSPAKNNDPFEDLLMNGNHRNSKRFNQNGSIGMAGTKNTVGVDDLLAGFGGISTSYGLNNNTNGTQRSVSQSTKTTNMSSEDPFLMFERSSASGFTSVFPLDTLEQITKSSNSASTSVSTSNPSPVLRAPPKPTDKIKPVNSSAASSIDDLEKFAAAHVHSNSVKSSQVGNRANQKNPTTKINKNKEARASDKGNQPNGEYDFDSFFGVSSRSSSLPKTRTPNSEGDGKKLNRTSSGESHKAPSGFSENMKSSASLDDLSFICGSPSIGGFEEVEGDTEERRKARLQRHKITQARMAKALADMNQRDFQSQQEQQERARISEIVDADIKRWSAGKEGNMRALLSTLQYVLSPEFGWQPVSLTDMITSTSVKKVYKKATLCVHPDKVQQKGASLTQRYTAEKVFDILKEAWTKFSKEELS